MNTLLKLVGVSQTSVSHTEKIVSALGGSLAILGILVIGQWSVGPSAAVVIVASMGASAVLLFAVPHGPLSQPWPLLGGHVVSAIIGVACAEFFTNELVAASLAVGAAIGAMYYLQCIHPPGGATALSAVIGGDAVHDLGYQFVITPVLLNVMVILLIGVIFNTLFHWRRYPAFVQKRSPSQEVDEGPYPSIKHEDFVYALSEIDSFIDVDEEDLVRIYNLATRRSVRVADDK